MIGRHPMSATRPGGPDGSINAVLRSVRQAAGMSLDVLAARTNFSKPYLSNVESGRRRVTVEIAEAYDAAFGTGGLLVRLLTGAPVAGPRRLPPEIEPPAEAAGLCPGWMAGGYRVKEAAGTGLMTAPRVR